MTNNSAEPGDEATAPGRVSPGGVTWEHTTYGIQGFEDVHQTSLSCDCNVDSCRQRCCFHAESAPAGEQS